MSVYLPTGPPNHVIGLLPGMFPGPIDARVLSRMPEALQSDDLLPGFFDQRPPGPNITNVSVAKIGRAAGFDQAIVTWSVDEDFAHYQLRVVSQATDPVSAGTLIETDQNPAGGGLANVAYQSTITDPELEAASPAEGGKVVKLFVQDYAGNWSV